MKKVFIVHGYKGWPNGGWLPWLMDELNKEGIWACSIAMPNPKSPVVSEWVSKIKSEIGEPNEDIFLVGHSLGVAGVLRYLESLPQGQKLGGAVLVSGFISPLDVGNEQSSYRPIDIFTDPKIDIEKVKKTATIFKIVHGKKDDIVPFSYAEEVAKSLDAELIPIPDGDHFSQVKEPICRVLPEVLEAVLKVVK